MIVAALAWFPGVVRGTRVIVEDGSDPGIVEMMDFGHLHR
jgi:hypothetical protein